MNYLKQFKENKHVETHKLYPNNARLLQVSDKGYIHAQVEVTISRLKHVYEK